MAEYRVNEAGVTHARELIDARQYVLRSEWGRVQPSADDENDYLATHTWDEYSAWHLGLTEGANDETKAYRALVSSLAPSVSPRCHAEYSSHVCVAR